MFLEIFLLSFQISTFVRLVLVVVSGTFGYPLELFFSFCQAYLNQEFVGGSSFVVGSLDLLEVRLLSLLLLVLVDSGEVGLWGVSDVFRSSEKLDVRLLSWRVGVDTFGLWGIGCLLGGVLGI